MKKSYIVVADGVNSGRWLHSKRQAFKIRDLWLMLDAKVGRNSHVRVLDGQGREVVG